MDKFTVAAANGKVTTYEGIYKVTDAGVLSVRPADGNPVVYSAVGWLALEVLDAATPPSPVLA